MTDRQRTILSLLADGWLTREIAQELGVSVRTVKNDMGAFMQFHGLRTRPHAIAYSIRRGWI